MHADLRGAGCADGPHRGQPAARRPGAPATRSRSAPPHRCNYAAVFLGALRAGVAVAPLAPGSTPASLARMHRGRRGPRCCSSTRPTADVIGPAAAGGIPRIALDGSAAGRALRRLAGAGRRAARARSSCSPPRPSTSSIRPAPRASPRASCRATACAGRTCSAARKLRVRPRHGHAAVDAALLQHHAGGVLPDHRLRRLRGPDAEVRRGGLPAARRAAPRHAHHAGAGAVPAPDGAARLRRARPVVASSSSSAPARPSARRSRPTCCKRWPGGLIEFYGMTEGGGTCILEAHLHPDKLHTVGRPAEGSDIRLIDEDGREVAPGETGEVVGQLGRHDDRLPPPAREDARGRMVRRPTASASSAPATSGRFDADGFLTLFDRKKDMIISGGFNIYPSDLEAVLRGPSGRGRRGGGRRALGAVGRDAGGLRGAPRRRRRPTAETLLQWTNDQLGKTQRLARLQLHRRTAAQRDRQGAQARTA